MCKLPLAFNRLLLDGKECTMARVTILLHAHLYMIPYVMERNKLARPQQDRGFLVPISSILPSQWTRHRALIRFVNVESETY